MRNKIKHRQKVQDREIFLSCTFVGVRFYISNFVHTTRFKKIGKPNNLKVFGDRPKRESQTRLDELCLR